MSPLSDLAQRNSCSLSWMPGFGSWQFPLLTLRSQNPELSHPGGPSGLPSSGTWFLGMRRWSHGDPTCILRRRKWSRELKLRLAKEKAEPWTQPTLHGGERGLWEKIVMGAPPASHRGEGGAAGAQPAAHGAEDRAAETQPELGNDP